MSKLKGKKAKLAVLYPGYKLKDLKNKPLKGDIFNSLHFFHSFEKLHKVFVLIGTRIYELKQFLMHKIRHVLYFSNIYISYYYAKSF